jgi:putative acetyltransferase
MSSAEESMPEITIRPETPSDIDAIREINVAAFLDHPYSHQTEHLIVDALRAAGALEISLVALRDERPGGHVAFSKATVGASKEWFLLGPVAVLPELQRQGIGSALVGAGLEQLRSRGAPGCVLVGDPGFYRRFGFRSFPGLAHEGVPDENVLCLPFGVDAPRGSIHAHDAFSVEAGDGGDLGPE